MSLKSCYPFLLFSYFKVVMKSPFIGFLFFLQNPKMLGKTVHQHGWIPKLAATGILDEWDIPRTTSRDDNHGHVFLLVRNLVSSATYPSIYSAHSHLDRFGWCNALQICLGTAMKMLWDLPNNQAKSWLVQLQSAWFSSPACHSVSCPAC